MDVVTCGQSLLQVCLLIGKGEEEAMKFVHCSVLRPRLCIGQSTRVCLQKTLAEPSLCKCDWDASDIKG